MCATALETQGIYKCLKSGHLELPAAKDSIDHGSYVTLFQPVVIVHGDSCILIYLFKFVYVLKRLLLSFCIIT